MSRNNQRNIESFFFNLRYINGENEISSSQRPRILADTSSQSEFPPMPIPSVTDEGSVAVSILYSVLIIGRIQILGLCGWEMLGGGTRFRLALKISWIFFSGIFFEYISHESYNAKKLNFLELSHQGKHFGFVNYQEQASKMPCGCFGTKPARAQAFISMSRLLGSIVENDPQTPIDFVPPFKKN